MRSLGRRPATATARGGAHADHLDALTALRAKRVDAVDTADVLSVLKPFWLAAPETASRLRGRIEALLSAAMGDRTGPNPAQWRNRLDPLLPKTRQAHVMAPRRDALCRRCGRHRKALGKCSLSALAPGEPRACGLGLLLAHIGRFLKLLRVSNCEARASHKCLPSSVARPSLSSQPRDWATRTASDPEPVSER